MSRTFKTEWFSKAAKKALISDLELCKAIEQVKLGQCDNLGGGVFKKRLQENRQRSIIVAKGGNYWVYSFLFAKKDRENIDEKELDQFKALADLLARKTETELEIDLRTRKLEEICNAKEV